jgi:hypothetical protein
METLVYLGPRVTLGPTGIPHCKRDEDQSQRDPCRNLPELMVKNGNEHEANEGERIAGANFRRRRLQSGHQVEASRADGHIAVATP